MREFAFLLPEFFLLLTLAGALFSEITYHGEKLRIVTITVLAGLFTALLQLIAAYSLNNSYIFSGALVADRLSLFFKLFFIILAIFSVILTWASNEISIKRRTECYAFIVAACLAMCVVSSAVNLLVIFLCLQLMNVVIYFLAGYSKEKISSIEAAIKYMMFSVVSGAFYIFASALIFSHTKSLNLAQISQTLITTPFPQETALLVFVLLIVSLGFYAATFPMYLWMPDVMEGAPTSASVFIGIGTPAVGLAMIVRYLSMVFSQGSGDSELFRNVEVLDWAQILALLAGFTMLIGSLLAVRQTSVKRMLGCLIMSQTGYLLMGLIVLNSEGIAALLLTLTVSLISVMGLFFVFSYLFDRFGSDRLDVLQGGLKGLVPESIYLFCFLASFVGFPPFPGFIGRFLLISSTFERERFILAALAVASEVLLAVAFARVAYYLTRSSKTEVSQPRERHWVHHTVSIVLLVPLIVLTVYAEKLLLWAGSSLIAILG